MRRVGIASIRHIDKAEFKFTVLPRVGYAALVHIQIVGNLFRRQTVPRAVIVCELPEVEQILAELVSVGIAVEERVSIVARKREPLCFTV